MLRAVAPTNIARAPGLEEAIGDRQQGEGGGSGVVPSVVVEHSQLLLPRKRPAGVQVDQRHVVREVDPPAAGGQEVDQGDEERDDGDGERRRRRPGAGGSRRAADRPAPE
jgi:hypothetical protein